jgi:YD repeat-containing protein
MQSFGRIDRFARVGPTTWEGARGRFDRFTFDGVSRSVLWMDGGTELRFATERLLDGRIAGILTAIVSPNGNSLQLEYEPATSQSDLLARKLVRMIESFGRSIDFLYEDPDYPHGVSTIREVFSGREVRYDYSPSGQLLSVRSPTITSTAGVNDFAQGKTTTYTYREPDMDAMYTWDEMTRLENFWGEGIPQMMMQAVAQYQLASVVYPNESGTGTTRLEWTYHGRIDRFDFGYVAMHTIGSLAAPGSPGGRYSYAYERVPDSAFGSNDPATRTRVTDRRGTVTAMEFNQGGQMLSETVVTQGLRPSAPAGYTRQHRYNADGVLIESQDPEGNGRVFGISDASGLPRRSQANQTATVWVPDAARGGDQSEILMQIVYEPIYNRPFRVTAPRGFEPGNSSDDFTTTYLYDYMEDLVRSRAIFAPRMGMTEAELTVLFLAAGIVSTGDVNGDGTTQQVAGNVVQVLYPKVTLPPDAVRVGLSPTQRAEERMVYNGFGQKVRHVDAEGNVHTWEYFGANDPDGDGVIDVPGSEPSTGGYLRAEIHDIGAPE